MIRFMSSPELLRSYLEFGMDVNGLSCLLSDMFIVYRRVCFRLRSGDIWRMYTTLPRYLWTDLLTCS